MEFVDQPNRSARMSKPQLNFEERLRQAIRAFWRGRESAVAKQKEAGKADQGNRGAVTGGKNLDGFRGMILDVVRRHGPVGVEVHLNKTMVVLPGFFRPTKLWDILIIHEGRLLAALELKSLCGPSFGNNAKNRCEEAIGSGHDFRKAQSEGLFGRGVSPFLGYFIFIEDAPASRSPVSTASPHFPADICFQGASYQARMRILCERMVESQIYSAAAVLAASSDGDGAFHNLSGSTSFQSMLARLAGYLSGESSAAASDSALVREDAPQEPLGFLAGDFFSSLDEE
jgi:hypothetical protein